MMAQSGHVESENYYDRPPASRDWLHHTNQSLTRLKDVKKTSIWLNGGPREREVNCQCSYRSKSRDSFLSLETGPPQLHIDSQETASMKDLSVPEIMKQFHERQKSKLKRRPQSSTVYSSRSAEKKQDWQKPSENNYSAFISVKGQTVTPQHRPPPGSLPLRETKKDDTSYKGLVYLDRQQEELDRSLAPHDLWRYSAAFCEDEDSESTNPPPPPPRASPEPSSPKLNWPEVLQSAEEAYSEEDDDDDLVDESQETRSISSAGSRSLVFAIPTGGNEGTESDDEQTPSLLDTGRVSSDYVARSESMLHKICDKSQAESAVISDMLVDMKSTNEKISQLRISPRDLDLELTCDATTPSVLLAKMEIECTAGTDQETTPQHEIEYETMWVEEPQVSNRLNALSNRFPRACSARYMTQHKTSRVRKQQSESSLALKGKTMEFFNPEDLVAKNLSRDQRKNPRHNDFTGEEHEMLEKREDTDPDKVVTKPPLPKWNTSKTKKRHKLKQKRQSGTENSSDSSILDQPSKSSLRKSSSEGNIHLYQAADTNLSLGSNLKLKSVTFRRDVLSQVDDVKVPLDSSQLPTYSSVEAQIVAKPAVQTCAWSQSSGVVINNGLEMKEANLQEQEISAVEITDKESRLSHTRKTAQSSRAKLLAKMKELPGDEELCPCRTVTRPTTALITELRNSKSRTKETSLKNDKLLKHRVTRPSSAPLKRSSGNGDILRLEKPHSPVSKPRAMSAKGQRKRTGSEGGQTRSRPSSAHVGKLSSKDARRSRAAAKVLKDGFLFKEKPPPPLPAASKESQKRREEHGRSKQDNNNNKSLTLPWNKEEEIVASEECHEVFARLQEKGIDVSMDTIKRGLMAPARRAGDYQVTGLSLSSNLLSRPENWLTEEHARVQIWEKALKNSK